MYEPSFLSSYGLNSTTTCLNWEFILRWGFLIGVLISLQTFVLILVVFFFFFFFFLSHYVSAKFHLWQSSRLRIGMLSLITISPVITTFHSYCLSHHIFDQVTLWPAWVGIETAIFWQCSGPVAQRREALSLYGSRWALSEDSGFNSYTSQPGYLVKNVVR